jgi:nucleoside-diphosphate-sugar epimerase
MRRGRHSYLLLNTTLAQSTYGMTKAVGEMLVNEYSRRGERKCFF